MSSREVSRVVQHAAGVHKASMDARNGYSSVVFPRLPHQSYREANRSTCTKIPRAPSIPFQRLDHLYLDSRPPLHPRSVIATRSLTVVAAERTPG